MRFAKVAVAVFAVCLILASAGVSEAASVTSLWSTDGTTTNNASDNNAEYLYIDNDRSGYLDIGDVLVGAIDINTLTQTGAGIGGISGNDQWTGVFALEIKDLFGVQNANTAIETANIVFGAWSGFEAWIAALPGGAPAAPAASPTGAFIVRLWTNSSITSDFTTDNSNVMVNIASAATGSWFWDLGFTDATKASHVEYPGGVPTIVSTNGEGWVSRNGGTAWWTLPAESSGSTFGIGNFALSILQQAAWVPMNVDTALTPGTAGQLGATAGDLVDIVGSSTVRGAGGTGLGNVGHAGFEAGSDTNFSFLAYAVPVPGAVWMGLMMLGGLGAMRTFRRKNRI
jgi:hypothetical protein